MSSLCMHVCAQSCPTLCEYKDCSLPGSFFFFKFYFIFRLYITVLVLPNIKMNARLFCPWNFPGKNTGVGYHFLLQGMFQNCLLHWQADCLPLSHLGSPINICILKSENAKSKQMNLVTDFTPSQKLTQTRL